MTVGVQVAIYLEMPCWLESMGVVSPEQWMDVTESLKFTMQFWLY